MTFIYDIIALLVIAFFIWRGKKRGFIKTVAGLLSLILAFSCASMLASAVAPSVSEKFVAAPIRDYLTKEAEAEAAETGEQFKGVLSALGISEDITKDLVSARPIKELIAEAASKLAEKITRIILCVIFFIILLFVFKLLFKLVDKIFDLPVLNSANNVLGLVCGGLIGIIYVSFAATILYDLGILIGGELLNETYLVRLLVNINPLKL